MQIDVFDTHGGDLMDPLTGCLLLHPVKAEDGHTYSRAALLTWIRFHAEKNMELISPKTSQPMGTSFAPDTEKEEMVEQVLWP